MISIEKRYNIPIVPASFWSLVGGEAGCCDAETLAWLLRAMRNYHRGESIEGTPERMMLWALLKADIDGLKAYHERRKASGHLGGRLPKPNVAKGFSEKPTETKANQLEPTGTKANQLKPTETKANPILIEKNRIEKNRSINTPLTPPPQGGEARVRVCAREEKPAKVSIESPDFDRFWAAYPRKTGKGKAAEAFKKAKRSADWPGLDRVMDALVRVRRSEQWTRDGGAFIPHPATWLNQMRWLDDPEPTAGGSAPITDAPPPRYEFT